MAEGAPTSSASVLPAFRWLRFGGHGASGRSRSAPEPGAVTRLAQEGRRELLDEIAAFLLANDLAVNPANLTIAWNAFSGTLPNLRRRIDERTRAGEKIQQGWLDKVAAWIDEGRTPHVYLHTPDNRLAPELALRFHAGLVERLPGLPPLPSLGEGAQLSLIDG